LRYLPPYSPDFNPIEMAFSKLKAVLRSERKELSTGSGTRSAVPFRSSGRRNAPTTSPLPAMNRIKPDVL
jgi:transposase